MAESIESQLGDSFAQECAFLNKYLSLRNKCEQIQQANEKLVNRLQHVKKLVKRYKKERRFLAHRLDDYGDSYKEVQVPVMWEEDQMYNILKPPPPYPGKETSGDSLPKRPVFDRGSMGIMSMYPHLIGHKSGDAGSSSGTVKVETDPNAPKKPANAYLMYCQHQRAAVLEEYSKEHTDDIANHELTKRLAQRWGLLSPDEKKVYYDMYEQSKERYEREMMEYSGKDQALDSDRSAYTGKDQSLDPERSVPSVSSAVYLESRGHSEGLSIKTEPLG